MKELISSKTNRFLFFAIVIIAIILRFVWLAKFPVSLNWDEVSHGYNAYSILKTGSDEWGKFLPITNFRAYGDYPLALNLYLTIPAIAAFGLTGFAIRFPHALLGVGTVFATYFFVFGLTKKKSLAILTSLLVAVDPWTVFTSRFVLQSNLSIFFLILAAALFFNREKVKWFLPAATISFGLTLFSYHTTRIFSPLLLIALIFIYRNDLLRLVKKFKKSYITTTILLVVFFAPLPVILMNPEARARSSVVFLLDEGATQKIISERNTSQLPNIVKRVVYNRPVYFLTHFGKNYLDYFSPDFLFLKGGTQYQFSVPNFGLLYLVNLPFFFVGLVMLLKLALKNKDYRLVLAWLLLAPIPASITQERFAVLRASTLLPIPELLSVLGLVGVVNFLNTKKSLKSLGTIVLGIYLVGLIFGVGKYVATYLGDYQNKYSWSWQYGYSQVADYIKENYANYDKIIMTKKYGEPHEFLLFYLAYDPIMYRNDPNLNRFYQSSWYWVDGFDKFYFVNDWQVQDISTSREGDTVFIQESQRKVDCTFSNCLLISSPGNVPTGWLKLETVNFLSGKPAFEIYKQESNLKGLNNEK